ncbi:cdk-12 [Symbiodinium microadriaticum]|nr:cdk-12 [Symbiodinium sp. KB8]CAE7856857.1 cdk-12 [Symbiodinium microadriaticum]
MRQAAVGGVDVAEEFDVLTSVGQHPNVVRAFGVLTSSLGRPALVLELAAESLHAAACRLKAEAGWIVGRKSLVPLFQQFLVGLSYVHGRSFLHLDVKPSNILVFGDSRAAVADFGLARAMVEETCGVIGNRAYTEAFRCPECLMADDRKVRLTCSADVWAAAVSFFDIFSPKDTVLWRMAPKSFARDTEEGTAAAIRSMAVRVCEKDMPYDDTTKKILERSLVPARQRLSLTAFLDLTQKKAFRGTAAAR